MATKPVLRILAACLIAFLTTGCGEPPSFRIETVVHPDGSCDRSIWQPKEHFLPPLALTPEWNQRWKTVADVADPPGASQPSKSSDSYHYFTATGTFAHPRDIPPHYHCGAKDAPDLGSSDLERTYETKDFGLVVEHRWQEKITNIVTMSSFLNARDDLLDRLVPIWIDALEKIFGPDYDLSRLAAYIRYDGRRLLDNIALILYDAASHGQVFGTDDKPRPELIDRLLDQAQRADLDRALILQVFTHKPDEPAHVASLSALLQKCVTQYFRHHDGKSLTDAEAADLIQSVIEHRRYQTAIERQRKRMNWLFEPNKPLDKQATRTLQQMTGLYFPFALFSQGNGAPIYHFETTLPGETIETNGTMIAPGRARWQFTGLQLFPSGFEMHARSIVINRESQQKVLGKVIIATPAQAIELIDLVNNETPVLEALRKFFQTGDRTALSQWKAATPEAKHRLKKLRELLSKP
jgi:hypothetical protein